MESRYNYVLRYALAFTDLFLINICLYLVWSNSYTGISGGNFKYTIIIYNLIWLLTSSIFRLYYQHTLQRLEKIYRATWKSTAVHLFLFSLLILDSNRTHYPFMLLIVLYSLIGAGLLLSRFAGTWLLTLLHRNQNSRTAVAILGMNDGGLRLADYLGKQNSLNFVGFLDEGNRSASENIHSAKNYLKLAADSGIEEVFVSIHPNNISNLNELIDEGERHCIRLKFVPDLTAIESGFKLDIMGNFTILSAKKDPLQSIHNRVKKRVFDIAVSMAVLVFIFSWLLPLLAIIIKIQSRGPVFFAQLRTGRNNKPFWCYKFRSMRVNAESDTKQTQRGDDRITPIGRFMRRTSLDEFPQFFNVLMGYMSIIGPRPHMLSHTSEYRMIIDKYMTRQFVKPGISGWAQINGYRGETKENSQMEKRIQHDLWYMENWTAMLDLKITFLTVINLLKVDENSY